MILGRIAENNSEIQRQDHEKEVEILKEEIKRLKEERVGLQRKMEEGSRVNSDLQEQITQLTKHVKAIPELRRDLNNMQNQRNNMDRKMKEQSEQARGTSTYIPSVMKWYPYINKDCWWSLNIFLQLKWTILWDNFLVALLKRRCFWGNPNIFYFSFHSRSCTISHLGISSHTLLL